ncbi:MAG: hypothetical protein ACREH6_09590, partial [Geminicoccaceae bacterium]
MFPGVAGAGAGRVFDRWWRAARPKERRRMREAVASLGGDADPGALPADVFWILRRLALAAAFGDPRHGGNQGGWGWRLVGSNGDPQPRGFTAEERRTAA